jgi:hypothetical protein
MTERARPRTVEREVRVIFEPSRTAAKCLTCAYVRVVPIRRRGLRSGSDPVPSAETPRRGVEGRRG